MSERREKRIACTAHKRLRRAWTWARVTHLGNGRALVARLPEQRAKQEGAHATHHFRQHELRGATRRAALAVNQTDVDHREETLRRDTSGTWECATTTELFIASERTGLS